MKKSIYEIYVPVTSQEQADRLKAICVKYGLPTSNFKDSFTFFKKENEMYLRASTVTKHFFVSYHTYNKNPITESEFELLAKEFKQ